MKTRIALLAFGTALAVPLTAAGVAPANAADLVFDPKFAECLNTRNGRPANAPIDQAFAERLTRVYCPSAGLDDLTGIEHLVNVDAINISGNQIAVLPSMAALSKLWYVEVNSSGITSLAGLSGNRALTTVLVSDNHLRDIEALRGATKLVRVDVQNNQIASLAPLAEATRLTAVYAQRNQLKDLDGLARKDSLAALWVGQNQISDLSPLRDAGSLAEFNLAANQVSDLDPLSALTQLQNINFEQNRIFDLSPLQASLRNAGPASRFYLQNQSVVLPETVVGRLNESPVRGFSGPADQLPVVLEHGDHADLTSDRKGWVYRSAGEQEFSWSQDGPVGAGNLRFSGTLAQAARAVPTTLSSDFVETGFGIPCEIDVLANDGLHDEPSLDPTSLELIDAAGVASAELTVRGGRFEVVDGRVRFEPTKGFHGEVETAAYRVSNDQGVPGTAEISVTVQVGESGASGGAASGGSANSVGNAEAGARSDANSDGGGGVDSVNGRPDASGAGMQLARTGVSEGGDMPGVVGALLLLGGLLLALRGRTRRLGARKG